MALCAPAGAAVTSRSRKARRRALEVATFPVSPARSEIIRRGVRSRPSGPAEHALEPLEILGELLLQAPLHDRDQHPRGQPARLGLEGLGQPRPAAAGLQAIV